MVMVIMKKELIFTLMIISLFLVSACDIYDTLYVKQPAIQDDVLTVPEGDGNLVPEGQEEVIDEITLEELFGEEVEVVHEGEVLEEEVELIEIEEDIFEPEGEVELISEEPVEEEMFEENIEVISEEATVIITEETELVSLVPQAEDPDNDALVFAFTSPLDETGEWQTTYGDAGEYTVTVTASDGTLTANKEVLIIVSKKEEAPVFESFNPEDSALEIEETNILNFDVRASDLNNDRLSYTWKLDGVEVGDEGAYSYASTYEDSGSHTVKITVSDTVFETERIWAVSVNNVNREPIIEEIEDIEAKETDAIIVVINANDPDADSLSYVIDDERFYQDGNVFTWETTFDDAGEHTVSVTVSDGVAIISEEFMVAVENVNRPPVILNIVQK